jgi:ribonuclease Z
VKPGIVYDSAGVRVRAIPVLHGSFPAAYGYRVDTPDRSIVIAGDTRPADAVVDAARGVDVLVHEAYIAARVAPEDRPGGEFWPQYMREFHTSGLELGALAAKAQPKVLIITHFGGPPDQLREDIRHGGWSGPVIIGADLGRY